MEDGEVEADRRRAQGRRVLPSRDRPTQKKVLRGALFEAIQLDVSPELNRGVVDIFNELEQNDSNSGFIVWPDAPVALNIAELERAQNDAVEVLMTLMSRRQTRLGVPQPHLHSARRSTS